MTKGRLLLRRSGVCATLCAVLTVGATAGCGLAEKRAAKKRANETTRQAALEAVETRIAAQPNVTGVDTVYVDTIAIPATLTVKVRVRQGSVTDLEPMLDFAERVVWRSDVRPLITLSLVASDLPGPLGKSRVIDVEEQAAALTAKHGPRPVAP